MGRSVQPAADALTAISNPVRQILSENLADKDRERRFVLDARQSSPAEGKDSKHARAKTDCAAGGDRRELSSTSRITADEL